MTESPPTEKTVSRALLIGINYFGTSSQLNGCINDVHNIRGFLTAEQDYPETDIRVLTDAPGTAGASQPTRANIIAAFTWLHQAARDNPDASAVRLFVHYSGHGSFRRDTSHDELDGRDESICPVDYATSGVIVDDDLRRMLVDPVAHDERVKLTCLFDCCHSGTVLDLRFEYEIALRSGNPDLRRFSVMENRRQPKTRAEVVLFSGSLDKQYSADAWINNRAQGAMTWGFLQVMRRHKRVTYKRFLAELQILLKQNRYEQIPHLCAGKFLALKRHMEC